MTINKTIEALRECNDPYDVLLILNYTFEDEWTASDKGVLDDWVKVHYPLLYCTECATRHVWVEGLPQDHTKPQLCYDCDLNEYLSQDVIDIDYTLISIFREPPGYSSLVELKSIVVSLTDIREFEFIQRFLMRWSLTGPAGDGGSLLEYIRIRIGIKCECGTQREELTQPTGGVLLARCGCVRCGLWDEIPRYNLEG